MIQYKVNYNMNAIPETSEPMGENLMKLSTGNLLSVTNVAVHRGVMMADTLSFNAKIGVVDF